jgi:ribonuclease HII
VSATGETSLGALRARIASLRSEEALARLAAQLDADARAGAGPLAAACRRRARALARERVRIDSLFALRERLRAGGARQVAGVDEVGIGPLAGPVVAAAVVLPEAVALPGLDDSKRLSAAVRERLDRAIRAQAVAIGVGEVWNEEIDRINVYRAGLLAMRRAVEALPAPPDHLLVDARTVPGVAMPQTALIGGDARDGSIAAASIVAKVYRDAIMRRLDARYPAYGFRRHMGYATREHLDALRRVGACPIHRRSFEPVAQLPLV